MRKVKVLYFISQVLTPSVLSAEFILCSRCRQLFSSPTLLKDVWIVPKEHWRIPVISDWGSRHRPDPRPPATATPGTGTVDPLVCFHGKLPLEAHAALWAGEGSLTRVHAPVIDQQRRVVKAAPAVHAHMASLAGLRICAGYLGLAWGSFGWQLYPCRGLGSHRISLLFSHLFRLQLSRRSLCQSLGSFLGALLLLI